MDLLNQVFKEYLDKFMILLIDDILMYSKSWDEHKEHFCIVLQTLKEHKLYEKIFECELWLDTIVFLGHMVSMEVVSLDSSKVEAISKWLR